MATAAVPTTRERRKRLRERASAAIEIERNKRTTVCSRCGEVEETDKCWSCGRRVCDGCGQVENVGRDGRRIEKTVCIGMCDRKTEAALDAVSDRCAAPLCCIL